VWVGQSSTGRRLTGTVYRTSLTTAMVDWDFDTFKGAMEHHQDDLQLINVLDKIVEALDGAAVNSGLLRGRPGDLHGSESAVLINGEAEDAAAGVMQVDLLHGHADRVRALHDATAVMSRIGGALGGQGVVPHRVGSADGAFELVAHKRGHGCLSCGPVYLGSQSTDSGLLGVTDVAAGEIDGLGTPGVCNGGLSA